MSEGWALLQQACALNEKSDEATATSLFLSGLGMVERDIKAGVETKYSGRAAAMSNPMRFVYDRLLTGDPDGALSLRCRLDAIGYTGSSAEQYYVDDIVIQIALGRDTRARQAMSHLGRINTGFLGVELARQLLGRSKQMILPGASKIALSLVRFAIDLLEEEYTARINGPAGETFAFVRLWLGTFKGKFGPEVDFMWERRSEELIASNPDKVCSWLGLCTECKSSGVEPADPEPPPTGPFRTIMGQKYSCKSCGAVFRYY